MSNPILANGQPKFDVGSVFLTPGAEDALAQSANGAQMLSALLARHASGDWGDLDASDCAMNDRAVSDGNMILSQYRLNDETILWIISDPVDDASKRVTTVLLPEER